MNKTPDFAALVNAARSRLGVSTYRLNADPELVPDVVDCSSFMGWCYLQIDIVLPRYSWEQHAICIVITLAELRPGDIIFMKPKTEPHPDRPRRSNVGHVCLYIGNGRVIHAADPSLGVVEWDFEQLKPERIVGYGRPDLEQLRLAA